jgi:hypothetical protein
MINPYGQLNSQELHSESPKSDELSSKSDELPPYSDELPP